MLRNFRPAEHGRDRPLFQPSTGSRRLNVVLDMPSTWPDAAEPDRKANLLEGLLRHSSVQALFIAPDGTPPGVPRLGQNGSSAPVGWIEVTEADDDAYVTHELHYGLDGAVRHSAITGDVARGELCTWDVSYADLDSDAAAQRRHNDSVVLGAADAVGADLLVTSRPFLLGGSWFGSLPLVVCEPTDALGLVGQFLRLRGVYAVDATPERGVVATFNRGLYFWVATRALLPEGWRWFSHCVSADEASSGADITVLAQSVFQRVKRTLMARDLLRWHMSLPQDNDVADDALSELDRILVDLVGAFDALARVAHRALELEGDERRAGWQYERWLKFVHASEPALSTRMGSDTPDSDLFEVIRLLRNSVHGAGLQSLGLSRGIGPRRGTAVSLPIQDVEALVRLLQRNDWQDEWGLTQFAEGRFHVAPDLVVEHLLNRALPLMNSLMRETPVERLVTAERRSSVKRHEDSDDPTDPFALRHQQNLKWQIGLE